MRSLNFYPFYEYLLRSRQKTTTFRVNEPLLKKGDTAVLTVGWDESNALALGEIRISDVYKKRIADLDESDFEGESQDCKSREATKLVLSAIYRKVVTDADEVWVVRFMYKQ